MPCWADVEEAGLWKAHLMQWTVQRAGVGVGPRQRTGVSVEQAQCITSFSKQCLLRTSGGPIFLEIGCFSSRISSSIRLLPFAVQFRFRSFVSSEFNCRGGGGGGGGGGRGRDDLFPYCLNLLSRCFRRCSPH